MNTIIQFNKLPWFFRYIIPTQIDVDGISYPLNHKIEILGTPRFYGHHRLKLIFLGFLKLRATIIDANQKTNSLMIIFRNENWFYYLISYSAVLYLFFSKSNFGAVLAIFICMFVLFIFVELLINFVILIEVNVD